ncbi:MAG TPA: YbhB/YbcL family Raf kinase inhibitor-like protein [Candidatus Hydrogenedentes bacterium]|nr:YbhB/YbcL family Raf kinase inhibitor-like protein [Candidatus Hydrogenedentota bacterium]
MRLRPSRTFPWFPGCALFLMTLALAPGCQKAPPPQPPAPENAGAAADASRPEQPDQEGGTPMTFRITSSAFADQATIPKEYTGDGEDVSPPLAWNGAPEATQSFALICDDPDAPVGTWVHWVIWNIPATETGLAEAIPPERPELSNGARQGTNDFRKTGYGGPAPPRGPVHRYFFRLYALDTALNLASGARKSDLEKALKGHILAQTELVGRYSR